MAFDPPWAGGRPAPTTAIPSMPEQKRATTLSGTATPSPMAPSMPSISVTTVREFPANRSFPHVLAELLAGQTDQISIARLGWNGVGLRVRLQRPDEYSKMTNPYLYIETPNDTRTPWVPSMSDLLANDWAVIV